MADIVAKKKTVGNTDYPVKDAELIDLLQPAASLPAVPFGYDPASTLNLTLGLFGGLMLVNGVHSVINASQTVLTANQVNYVEATRAGVVSANIAGFTPGRQRLYEATTNAGAITALVDKRPAWLAPGSPFMIHKLTKATGGGVGTTVLTYDEQNCDVYEFTGALTGNRTIELATDIPKSPFVVFNNTSGAFTLAVRDTGGAGVVVPQGARRLLYHDGADVFFADAGLQTQFNILDAIGAIAANGLIARTGAGAAAARTIVANGQGLSTANGTGAGGDPTISMAAATQTQIGTAEIATAAEILTGTDDTRVVSPLGLAGAILMQGEFSSFIPAWGMKPSINNGCAPLAQIAMGGTQPDMFSLDFDPTTQEFAEFFIWMPKSWNEDTFTFQPIWSHSATTVNFGAVWGMYAVAVGDGENLAAAFGTAAEVTDVGGNTNYTYQGAKSAAITPAGAPQENDLVCCRIYRNPAHASDTLAVDARLIGVKLALTLNARNDA